MKTELSETGKRIDLAYQTTLARPPSEKELNLALRFLGDSPNPEAWSAFYQSLFACIDFRYLD